MTAMTEPTAADRLFALIASIPGSGTVDWCSPARALLDEIAAAPEAAPPTGQERRDRYAQALLGPDAAGTLDSAADEMLAAVMAVAAAEQAGLRTAFNNQIDLFADEYDRHGDERRRLRDAAEAHRLALSTALGLGTGAPWDAIRERAAELAGQPAPVDRAAVLREEAARIRAHCPDHLDSDSAEGAWLACHCAVADDMERPSGTPQPETQAAPRRGDAVEQWLKTQRDAAADYPEAYQATDGLLDLYRLHADTGTPLGEHVCEGQAVGDCDCLEQPAAFEAEIVHACPPDGSGLTPCCGRTPFELPLGDRISSEAPVTCPAPAVTLPGKEA
jgi:hypothetical protein